MNTTLTRPLADISFSARLRHVLRAVRRDGIRLSGRRRPLESDGGDFVITHRTGPSRWVLGVGDAMGHDEAAEELARQVRRHVESQLDRGVRIAEVLHSANVLVSRLEGGVGFVSLLLLEFDAARHTVRIANAGSEEPLVVGRSGGVIALEGHGPALGLIDDAEYRESGPLRLPMGVQLLAFTDGVTDAVDAEGNAFGRAGAARALAESRDQTPRQVVTRVMRDAALHTGGAPSDVATVLAVRFER